MPIKFAASIPPLAPPTLVPLASPPGAVHTHSDTAAATSLANEPVVTDQLRDTVPTQCTVSIGRTSQLRH